MWRWRICCRSSSIRGARSCGSGWGCACRAVEDPGEVTGRPADEFRPDAIVCDYRLRDGLTGAEAIAGLRSHWGSAIPAILITGDTAPVRLREASDSGIPLVHKPVRPELLRSALLALVPPQRFTASGEREAVTETAE